MSVEFTTKGYIQVLKPDGTFLSQHVKDTEAMQSIMRDELPDGEYTIKYPDLVVDKKSPVGEVPPVEDPPVEEPPVEDPPVEDPPVEDPPVEDPPIGENEFDSLYAEGFTFPNSAAVTLPSPPSLPKVSSLPAGAVVAPFSARVYRATAISEASRGQIRHEYSRRQAFNCDNTRFLALDGNGSWYLYNAKTFAKIKTLGMLGGDCEPLWHPTDPALLRHTSAYGGLKWYTTNVETDQSSVLFDFTGKTPWAEADAFWTKAEGSASADGKTLCLMATRMYKSQSVPEKMYGVVTLDTETRQIVSQKAMSAYPDHISTSPSGRWCVISGSTTYAVPANDLNATPRQLHDRSEHSDLCVGPEGDDYYVFAAYSGSDEGWIVAVNIDTGARFRIAEIYGPEHSFMAAHISGQCFEKPGWVVVSTYGDASDYGNQVPSAVLTPLMRKVTMHELKPNGRHLDIAPIHANIHAGDSYFREPQATISRDGTRIMFASNWGAAENATAFMIGLPSVF